ncbi:MAG: hypothetical protein U1D26_03090 [Patescibacteria group bacterium]|nr:hypothetical protein [bacterium]MDZ4227439.1 hypothetical protein [Patescibacteria group bacterium]
MLPYRDSRLTYIVLAAFFVLLVGYAYFEARGLLFGPSITLAAPMTEMHEPFIEISGRADRISSLSMNGKAVEVTEEGAFSEPYLLSLGYNRIVLEARDKYGRSRSKVLEIMYSPTTSSGDGQAATSSPASDTGSTSPQEASPNFPL